jgi:hypothetical protein
MNQHRENLQKLIKMMKGVYDESITDNKSREMLESEAERYISYERLLSIRELTRMFIDELNSEYMQCSEGDEVVGFIEDTIEWLQFAYDFTIEHNAGSTGVKSLKVCSQALNDYKKVYKEAKESRVIKGTGNVIATIENVRGFEFGKRNKSLTFNTDGVVISNGELRETKDEIKVYVYDNLSNLIKDISVINNLKQISKIKISQKCNNEHLGSYIKSISFESDGINLINATFETK